MGYLKRIFLPGIINQSVLIGGGYATGREIVEYGARFGANGWISGLVIFIGFSVMSMLSIEACRRWNVFDYKSLLRKMVGKGWIAYEIVYVVGVVLIIAVMASAAGEILRITLGFDYWTGVVIIIVAVGFMNYQGEEVIAKFETFGTIALFAAYAIFSGWVFATKGDEIINIFKLSDTSYLSNPPGMGLILLTGCLYVGYNIGLFPASFFTYRKIQSTKESIVAGIISGLLMTIPWFLTYFAFMGYYPDESVIGAPIPWLVILSSLHAMLIVLFGIVIGWTLIETATGCIHGFISRVEAQLEETSKKPLTKVHKATISSFALVLSLVLAQVGIIDLVAKGYMVMAYATIAVYALPLLWYAPRLLGFKKWRP